MTNARVNTFASGLLMCFRRAVFVLNLKRFLSEAETIDKDVNKVLSILKEWNYETDSLAVGVHYALDAIKPVYNPDDYIYNYELIMKQTGALADLRASLRFIILS